MPAITTGVEFDTVAREWRMKWSDMDCLAAVQRVLDEFKGRVKAVDGVKSVQVRVRCGLAAGSDAVAGARSGSCAAAAMISRS